MFQGREVGGFHFRLSKKHFLLKTKIKFHVLAVTIMKLSFVVEWWAPTGCGKCEECSILFTMSLVSTQLNFCLHSSQLSSRPDWSHFTFNNVHCSPTRNIYLIIKIKYFINWHKLNVWTGKKYSGNVKCGHSRKLFVHVCDEKYLSLKTISVDWRGWQVEWDERRHWPVRDKTMQQSLWLWTLRSWSSLWW